MQSQTESKAADYLFISDFDQTLSFNDSGFVLSEMLGLGNFAARISGLAKIHMVQQGGELAYLLLHDPEYRRVRREDLYEVGKRVRLKQNIQTLSRLLENLDGRRFSYYVVSAAPQEVIQSALEGIVRPDHIIGTEFHYNESSGEIASIARVPAGYGKVAVLDGLRATVPLSHNRIVYVGDGSSDVHVMMHVNRLDGLTIAVSENRYINQIARRTVLSDDALSVLVPVLEEIAGWNSMHIREFFEEHGFALREWGEGADGFADYLPGGIGLEHGRGRGGVMPDTIGWVATAVFSASYFFRRPAALRKVQALAACLWIGYGLSIRALPVVIANVIVAAAALYTLVRSQKQAEQGLR